MIRFNPDTERKLKEDLANVGKANQGYNIYATVKGSPNHRRIGTLDPKRTAITFDGTSNLAPIIRKNDLEDATIVGELALVPIMVPTIQSAVGRLSETRVGKAKTAMLALVARLLRRGIISNPPKDPQRVIKEKDREIEHLKRVINAKSGLYADQIARGLMIPSVQDYPFDPTKLVNLPEGFDGVAVEIKGSRLHIDFVEGNYAGKLGLASMTNRQKAMRRAIKQGKVSVRLCHLILYSDGTSEWEIQTES
ncbi:hypothetical protein N8653_06450 [Euryarchaeota archaeon]|nr:hypothetical protein [Euryarchaeota archaeon]